MRSKTWKLRTKITIGTCELGEQFTMRRPVDGKGDDVANVAQGFYA
jgi:hypothetical protein